MSSQKSEKVASVSASSRRFRKEAVCFLESLRGEGTSDPGSRPRILKRAVLSLVRVLGETQGITTGSGFEANEMKPRLAKFAEEFSICPDNLGAFYEAVLAQNEEGRERKRKGAYYTPPELVERLLDACLEPAVAAILAEDKSVKRQEEALLNLKVLDPACGSGEFLVTAAKRLAGHLARLRAGESEVLEEEFRNAFQQVAKSCLYGVDVDRVALEICRLRLRVQDERAEPGVHLVDGNGLLSKPQPKGGEALDFLADGDFLFNWRLSFEEVFDRERPGFDVIIGNPPFVNAIEGGVGGPMKQALARRFPVLGGTADLSYYFLALCDEVAHPGGRIGLVLPVTILNSSGAEDLRLRLLDNRPPNFLFVPPKTSAFPGASAYTCLLAVGPEESCLCVREDSGNGNRGRFEEANWWSEFLRISGVAPNLKEGECVAMGSRFEVSAGMTARDAYLVRDKVKEEARPGTGQRLVTTGLIEPGRCDWGRKKCRHLGLFFMKPVIENDPDFPADLRKRLDRSRRPKVLVAGLVKRIEAFVDREGGFCGAVSTFTIYHPEDCLGALEELCEWLNSERATQILYSRAGASAVAGDYLVVKKKDLIALPLPK